MGRKRKKDNWMPPRVYQGRAAFEFHPRNATVRTIRLCSLYCSKATVWLRYEQEKAKLENSKDGIFANLAVLYFKADKYLNLSPRSQKDYANYSKKVLPVFGQTHVDNIKPEHVRNYMDLRAKSSKTQANREKAFMSAVFTWGYQRGKCKTNPCRGVTAFTEKPRERYITDQEYQTAYELAPTPVKIAMEISYLCAARKSDVLKLDRSHLREDGIFIRQGKTGKKQIKLFTPRLQAAIALANQPKTDDSEDKVTSFFLVHQPDGSNYTVSGFDSLWQKTKKDAEKVLGYKLDFTFHDIKAKAISDYEGDKQRFSGHKTASQVTIYDRKVERVETLNTEQH